jgi:hypothetical protein
MMPGRRVGRPLKDTTMQKTNTPETPVQPNEDAASILRTLHASTVRFLLGIVNGDVIINGTTEARTLSSKILSLG